MSTYDDVERTDMSKYGVEENGMTERGRCWTSPVPTN